MLIKQLHTNSFKGFIITFKNVYVGGGGVIMFHNTLHEQIYTSIRLFMFYGRILNLVGCARCVCVCCGWGLWGGGG